ncbi:MAG: D-Ala-D-Ala carboxypeptidase family metallohydrolase [Pseudomonadota bacterium]
MIQKFKVTRLLVACVALLLGTSLNVSLPGAMSGQAHAASTKCLPSILKKRLSQIRKKFGKVRVISTYRPGARIRGTGRPSYHASCRAVDFHPPRGKYRAVVSWLKKVHRGGVGTYSCGMHHIHIDNGPRVRFHKCIR